MRDLERAEIITSDFLLVSGDVISNIPLEPALIDHRARREKDKNAIMTMILREAGKGHKSRRKSSCPVFVIDAATQRCLHYEDVGHRRGGDNYINLDPETFTSSNEFEVREDLIDCRVDICSQDVLLAWSDNFDYTSVRKSFLRGVLKDYETYGKTVHTFIVRDHYAARLNSVRAYDAISRDIACRRTFPFCVGSNLISGQTYRLARGKNYQEEDVVIGKTASVKKSVVGHGTIIGDGSTVNRTTLGRRCKIGKNVIIEGAHIWDDVSVEDGTVIQHAIVADNTTIGKDCKIEPEVLVSYGTRLPERTFVSEGARVTKDQDTYRIEGLDEDVSDDSSTSSSAIAYQNPSASSSTSSISTLASSVAPIEAEDSSRRGSFRSDPSDAAENRDFHLEATASILDGLQKEDPPDTIILELNGYRMSTNASQHEVRKALIAALMKRVSNMIHGDPTSGKPGISAREAVKGLFVTYKPLVERTVFDKDAALKVDQVDLLLLVQKEVSGRSNGDQLMLFVANEAYDQDIVEEDGILQWWDDERSETDDIVGVRELTEQFINYLQEAEEEESDESVENDEDEED